VTIAQKIAQVNSNLETATRSGEFISYAKHLLRSKGGPAEALAYAENHHAAPRVQSVLKAAVAAGGTDTNDWGSELATFSNAFAATLKGFGAYDTIWNAGAFTKIPMRTKIAVTTIAASGGYVGQAQPKPITKLAFDQQTLDARKATAIVVINDELVRSVLPGAFSLFGDELRKGVARATDVDFLGRIIASDVEIVTSTGPSLDAIIADLSTALVLIDVSATSKVYMIAPPTLIRAMALMRGTGGAPAFPELGILGGSISGVTVVASDALAGTVVILDATQCAADTGPIFLDASTQASLQLDDDPSDGPQAVTSLFQTNQQALRAERLFASELLRSSGAAVISGVTTDVGTGT
jgi:hypothetical protein